VALDFVSSSSGVMGMFYGDSFHSMDAKHRVFVPKRFQQALGRDAEGNMVAFLTLGLEGCLFLFSEEGFQKALDRMDTQAFTGAKARQMQRLFFSNTHRIQLDASGRLLVPEKLREQVGFEKEIAMVGVIERAELWPRTRWEVYQEETKGDFDQLGEVLCGSKPDEGT